jgi:transposase-like protein
MLTVFYYYRFKNSLVDVVEHMALCGVHLSHETVRLWSQRIGTDMALKMRSRRRGNAHHKWNMDVTYLKVKGYDMYLYRALIRQVILLMFILAIPVIRKPQKHFLKRVKRQQASVRHRLRRIKSQRSLALLKRPLVMTLNIAIASI